MKKSFFLLMIACFLLCIACANSNANLTSRLLEDPEHYIKDSPNITKHDSTILYTGWYEIISEENNYKRQLDEADVTYYLNPKPIVTAQHIKSTEISENYYGDLMLIIIMNNKGTELWADATAANVGKQLGFVLDNHLLCVATVQQKIGNGVSVISRKEYDQQRLKNIATIIESER